MRSYLGESELLLGHVNAAFLPEGAHIGQQVHNPEGIARPPTSTNRAKNLGSGLFIEIDHNFTKIERGFSPLFSTEVLIGPAEEGGARSEITATAGGSFL